MRSRTVIPFILVGVLIVGAIAGCGRPPGPRVIVQPKPPDTKPKIRSEPGLIVPMI